MSQDNGISKNRKKKSKFFFHATFVRFYVSVIPQQTSKNNKTYYDMYLCYDINMARLSTEERIFIVENMISTGLRIETWRQFKAKLGKK